MSFRRILSELSALFGDAGKDLTISRIDIAVDVLGYAMEFFKERVFVARKRSSREIGTLKYDHEFKRGVETLNLGSRPNLFRIYDKTAQLQAIDRGESRGRVDGGSRSSPGSTDLDRHVICTRIERQCARKGVPEPFSTLRTLQEKALGINPFEPLRFLSAPVAASELSYLSASRYLKAVGLRYLVEQHGMPATMRDLNRRSAGRARKLIEGLPTYETPVADVGPPDLATLYRTSLQRQFNAEAS